MKALSIILGILLILGGFYCLLFPFATFMTAVWVLAVLLLVAGIMLIVNFFTGRKKGTSSVWDIIGGIITVLLSIFILINGWAQFVTETIVVYLFCVAILVVGIMAIITAVQNRKVPGSGWGWRLAFGILMTLLGVFSFFTPFADGAALGWLVSFFIVMEGVNLIAGGIDSKGSADA